MNVSAVSFGNNPTPKKSHEELQNEMLLKLYKEYTGKPFKYAQIDYFENAEPKVTIHREGNFIKRFLKKIFKFL